MAQVTIVLVRDMAGRPIIEQATIQSASNYGSNYSSGYTPADEKVEDVIKAAKEVLKFMSEKAK